MATWCNTNRQGVWAPQPSVSAPLFLKNSSSRFVGLPHLLICRPILQCHNRVLQNLTFLMPFFRLPAL